MSEYVVDLSGIRKTYRGGVEALKGIDLQVPEGCIYGLLGPNGAGKSTMVKILTTLIKKSGGTGTMLGRPLGDRTALQQVGLLPEHAQFPDYLTGRQVIEFTAGLQNVPTAETKQRTDELLDLVQMTEAQQRKIKSYSKGMKQRIGIAQALVNDPKIVFLDEPTDGVDPAGRRDFRVLMKKLREEGRTIFINTHILSELEPIVDRVAIISEGQLRGEGVLDDLRASTPEYSIEFEGTLSIEAANAMKAEAIKVESGLITVSTSYATEVQPVIDQLRQENLVIVKIERRTQSLEDLFIDLIDSTKAATPPPIPS